MSTQAPDSMRRIELQSAEDLRHLVQKLLSVAHDKTAKQLPVSDELRARVEALMTEYVHSTYALALPNLQINGLTTQSLESLLSPTPQEEFEPYDRRLHDEVTALHAAIEERTLKLAKLRREQPALVKKAYESEIKEEERRAEKRCNAWRKQVDEMEVEELEIGVVERGEVVEKTRKRVEVEVEELKNRCPKVAHQLGRAREAADYVIEKEGK